VPGKGDYAASIDYLAAELKRHDVSVRLRRAITSDDAELVREFDAVVVATGVHPRPLELPGADLPLVRRYPEAFADDVTGRRVAIIGGGGIAVDAAHYAGSVGAQVDVLYRGERVGARIGKSTRWAVLGDLRRLGVQVHRNAHARRITGDGVWISGDVDGCAAAGRAVEQTTEPELITADLVVLAVGQLPHRTVADLAAASGQLYRVVGGARDADGLDAVRAIGEAHTAARQLHAALAGAPRS
jgi:2,4-dienoyl-CoA reductase (NADPH2)